MLFFSSTPLNTKSFLTTKHAKGAEGRGGEAPGGKAAKVLDAAGAYVNNVDRIKIRGGEVLDEKEWI